MTAPGLQTLALDDQRLLREHCGGDRALLQTLVQRRLAGAPMAYLLGWVAYRGWRFQVDERAFITDPETGYMLDLVIAHLQALGDRAGSVCVAELGLGCGAIGISLLKAVPGIRLVGLEIDPAAVELAQINARSHGVALEALVSDFFSAWGDRPEPAVVYGDLPWGDNSSVYDEARPIEHYLAMPRHSAFPVGGPMGMHRRALQSMQQLGWSSQVFLNCGMLPHEAVLAMARAEGAVSAEMVQAAPKVAVLRCKMR